MAQKQRLLTDGFQIHLENDRMLEAFLEGAETGTIQSGKSGKRYMQQQMFREMMAIDAPRAVVTARAWAQFLQ